MCENNGYTEFTPTDAVTAGESIATRAAVFGMPSSAVDGDDVVAVAREVEEALRRARDGGGPSFLECRTHRWRGHHEGEESYAKAYRQAIDREDPIVRLEQAMSSAGLEPVELRASIEPEERTLIAEALAWAQAEPEPPVERAFEDVFA